MPVRLRSSFALERQHFVAVGLDVKVYKEIGAEPFDEIGPSAYLAIVNACLCPFGAMGMRWAELG